MQSKKLIERTILNVAIAGTACYLIFLTVIFFLGAPGTDSSQSPQNTVAGQSVGTADARLPIRLKIPKINVNAPVEYVGLAKDGAMDVPKGAANVAWFNQGTVPGENGSAVIAGHFGLYNGEQGVFDNLHQLRPGDKLYIEDEKRTLTTFVVVDAKKFDPNVDTTNIFGSLDGKAHLNLVTCAGVWNEVEKSFSKRLIVFADKE